MSSTVKWVLTVTLLSLFSSSVVAIEAGELPSPEEAIKLGMGGQTCAFWLETQEHRRDGEAWILLYAVLRHKHQPKQEPGVSATMDSVKARCESEPSASVGEITERYREEFENTGGDGQKKPLAKP